MTIEAEVEEPTLEKMAEAYVSLISSPPNGWGQHVHPDYGQSHRMLLAMQTRFGTPSTNKAIDAEFEKRRLAKHRPIKVRI